MRTFSLFYPPTPLSFCVCVNMNRVIQYFALDRDLHIAFKATMTKRTKKNIQYFLTMFGSLNGQKITASLHSDTHTQTHS